MEKDFYPNLNSTAVRLAVLWILLDAITKLPKELKDVKLTDIRFDNKCYRLYVKGHSILCYDRHMHYPIKREHTFAIHQFLSTVEEIVPNLKKTFNEKH